LIEDDKEERTVREFDDITASKVNSDLESELPMFALLTEECLKDSSEPFKADLVCTSIDSLLRYLEVQLKLRKFCLVLYEAHDRNISPLLTKYYSEFQKQVILHNLAISRDGYISSQDLIEIIVKEGESPSALASTQVSVLFVVNQLLTM